MSKSAYELPDTVARRARANRRLQHAIEMADGARYTEDGPVAYPVTGSASAAYPGLQFKDPLEELRIGIDNAGLTAAIQQAPGLRENVPAGPYRTNVAPPSAPAAVAPSAPAVAAPRKIDEMLSALRNFATERKPGRMLLGGLGIGLGAGALMSIVRELRNEKRRKKLYAETGRTDKDTLVLTLPKSAEAVSCCTDSVKSRPAASSRRVPVLSYSGPKRADSKALRHLTAGGAKFDDNFKVADIASWFPPGSAQSIAAGNVLGLAGAATSYKLVDALYMRHLQNKLRKDEENARQELLDALVRRKSGCWVDDVLPPAPIEKSAQGTDYPTGQGGLDTFARHGLGYILTALALSTGGTAYITKKLMDAKFNTDARRGVDVPKMRRISIRTAAGRDDEQEKESALLPALVRLEKIRLAKQAATCMGATTYDLFGDFDKAAQNAQDGDSGPSLGRALGWLNQKRDEVVSGINSAAAGLQAKGLDALMKNPAVKAKFDELATAKMRDPETWAKAWEGLKAFLQQKFPNLGKALGHFRNSLSSGFKGVKTVGQAAHGALQRTFATPPVTPPPPPLVPGAPAVPPVVPQPAPLGASTITLREVK